MRRADFERLRPALAQAGFDYLDDDFEMAMLLCFFAGALREAPLTSFEDVNDRLGTANGLASGRVLRTMYQLALTGYLDVAPDRSVQLTARGAQAARIMGVIVD